MPSIVPPIPTPPLPHAYLPDPTSNPEFLRNLEIDVLKPEFRWIVWIQQLEYGFAVTSMREFPGNFCTDVHVSGIASMWTFPGNFGTDAQKKKIKSGSEKHI